MLRENTIYAFRRAVELGYRYLETDVRTTSDGQLVVMHDENLDRISDGTGPVSRYTWAELCDLRVAGKDRIPLLSEAWEEFPDIRFNIDLKDEHSVAALAVLLHRHNRMDSVCVSSFSGARLRAFRRLAPGVPTGVPQIGVALAGFAPLLRRFRIDPGVVFQIPTRVIFEKVPLVRPDLIQFAHSTGRLVHVWTVDDAKEMERLIGLGVDGIISNDIAALKRVLQEHGLWEDAA